VRWWTKNHKRHRRNRAELSTRGSGSCGENVTSERKNKDVGGRNSVSSRREGRLGEKENLCQEEGRKKTNTLRKRYMLGEETEGEKSTFTREGSYKIRFIRGHHTEKLKENTMKREEKKTEERVLGAGSNVPK